MTWVHIYPLFFSQTSRWFCVPPEKKVCCKPNKTNKAFLASKQYYKPTLHQKLISRWKGPLQLKDRGCIKAADLILTGITCISYHVEKHQQGTAYNCHQSAAKQKLPVFCIRSAHYYLRQWWIIVRKLFWWNETISKQMIPFCRHFAAIATIFHNMWKSHFVMNHIDVAKYITFISSLYFVLFE